MVRTMHIKSPPFLLAAARPTRRQALGALGLAVGALGMAGSRVQAATEDDVLTEAAVLRDPDIPSAGNAGGDITIVEYFDYQCPYCRKIEPELRQVAQDDGNLKLVFKDWPILGGASIYAARMALATRYQQKYIEAHDAMIGLNARLTEAGARELLAGVGIDVDRATRDLATNAAAIDAVLARNDAQAKAFGFRGTPSFIVGKFRVPGILTMAQFERAIADARAAAKAKK